MSSKPVFRNEETGFIPEVYDNLKRIAEKYLRSHRGHTLQPTALVNEALIKFAGKTESQWESPAHFQACAARMMRWILLDHAKAKKRDKRGGGGIRITYDENIPGEESELDVIALDEALQNLAKKSSRLAQVVELRCFGGMSVEEVAKVMNISPRTVKRDWNLARAWLHRELSGPSKK